MDETKTIQVKWHPKTLKLIQIANEGLEYALVSDDYQQIHQLVWCKDFLQDAIYGYLNKSHIEIFGFKYHPDEDAPVSMNKTRVMITNWKDQEFGTRLKTNCLPLIHEAESKLNFDTSTILYKAIKTPSRYSRSGVWVLEGDKRWMAAPPMLSMYTLLIRIGMVRQEGDDFETTFKKMANGELKPYFPSEDASDQNYARRSLKGIKQIMDYGDQNIFGNDVRKNYTIGSVQTNSTYSMHEDCGIVSFSEGIALYHFPNWKPNKEYFNVRSEPAK